MRPSIEVTPPVSGCFDDPPGPGDFFLCRLESLPDDLRLARAPPDDVHGLDRLIAHRR